MLRWMHDADTGALYVHRSDEPVVESDDSINSMLNTESDETDLFYRSRIFLTKRRV